MNGVWLADMRRAIERNNLLAASKPGTSGTKRGQMRGEREERTRKRSKQ